MKNSFRTMHSLVAAVLFHDNPSKLLEISTTFPSHQQQLDIKGNFTEALPEKTSPLFQTIASPIQSTYHHDQIVEEDSKMLSDSSNFLPNNDFM